MGYLAGTVYPAANLGGAAMAISGGSDIMSGFVLATTEREPEVSEAVDQTRAAVNMLSLRKVPMVQKALYKKATGAGTFERDFRALGEFAEDAGEAVGSMIRDIMTDDTPSAAVIESTQPLQSPYVNSCNLQNNENTEDEEDE